MELEEDKLIISVGLNMSSDSRVGTDQKGDACWEQINQYREEGIPRLIRGGVAKNHSVRMKIIL